MAVIGTLVTRVKSDTIHFERGMMTVKRTLKETLTTATQFNKGFSAMRSAFKVAAIAGAALAIGRLGFAIVKAASDFEEAQQKFEVVFASVREDAKKTADAIAEGFGLSKREAIESLGATGDLLTGFGFAGDKALEMSEKVSKLGIDLASFTNIAGGAKRATDAITAALLGEQKRVKALGVVLLDEDVNARLAAKGMDKLTGVLRLQAKAQERLAIITEQSINAIGDFKRTSESTANQLRILEADFDNLKVSLGNNLIPAFKIGVKWIDRMVRNLDFLATTAKETTDAFTKPILGALFGPNDTKRLSDILDLNLQFIRENAAQVSALEGKILERRGREIINARKIAALSAKTSFDRQLSALREFHKARARAARDADTMIALFAEDRARREKKAQAEQDRRAPERARKKGLRDAAKDLFTQTRTPLENIEAELLAIATMFNQNFFEGFEQGAFRRIKELRKMRDEIRNAQADKSRREAMSIFEDTRTPLERIEKEMERLKTLFKEGAFEGITGAFDRRIKELKDAKKALLAGEKGTFKVVDLKNIILGGETAGGKKTEDRQLDEQKKSNKFLMEIAKHGIGGTGKVIAQ